MNVVSLPRTYLRLCIACPSVCASHRSIAPRHDHATLPGGYTGKAGKPTARGAVKASSRTRPAQRRVSSAQRGHAATQALQSASPACAFETQHQLRSARATRGNVLTAASLLPRLPHTVCHRRGEVQPPGTRRCDKCRRGSYSLIAGEPINEECHPCPGESRASVVPAESSLPLPPPVQVVRRLPSHSSHRT